MYSFPVQIRATLIQNVSSMSDSSLKDFDWKLLVPPLRLLTPSEARPVLSGSKRGFP